MGQGRIAAIQSRALGPVIKSSERCQKFLLLGDGKSRLLESPFPRRRSLVDGKAIFLGDFSPYIPVGRVQPAASKIEWISVCVGGESPSPEARSRLQQNIGQPRPIEPPGGRNSRRAAAYHRDLGPSIAQGDISPDMAELLR